MKIKMHQFLTLQTLKCEILQMTTDSLQDYEDITQRDLELSILQNSTSKNAAEVYQDKYNS